MSQHDEESTPLKALTRHCQNCSMQNLCLPAGVSKAELDTLEKRVVKSPPHQEGSRLFVSGSMAGSVYVVRMGSYKSVRVLENGDEQIVGVHLPGEMFGLDGLVGRRHRLDAIALETSAVCAIAFDRLDGILEDYPSLNRQLMAMVGRELDEQQTHQVLMGRRAAQERVARYLVRHSDRLMTRGFRGDSFALSLSRQDMGNYLGLQIETVSRAFGKLRDSEVIEVDRRMITITNMEKLRELAGADPQTCSD